MTFLELPDFMFFLAFMGSTLFGSYLTGIPRISKYTILVIIFIVTHSLNGLQLNWGCLARAVCTAHACSYECIFVCWCSSECCMSFQQCTKISTACSSGAFIWQYALNLSLLYKWACWYWVQVLFSMLQIFPYVLRTTFEVTPVNVLCNIL